MTDTSSSETMEPSDTIQATDDLVVEVGEDVLRVRRGEAAVVVYPREVRHLVDALVEGGVRIAPGRVVG